MGIILRYPLTPVPLSISHVGITMQKTPRSKLLQELEKNHQIHLEIADVTIIDCFLDKFPTKEGRKFTWFLTKLSRPL